MAQKCTIDLHKETWDLTAELEVEFFNKEDNTHTALSTIHENQTLVVEATLTMGGNILHHLCDSEIVVSVGFESCGAGAEFDADECKKLAPCDPGGNVVKFVFEVPPGTLKAGKAGKTYRLCLNLASKDCCGHYGFIFGHCGDIEIYVAPADQHP